MDAALRQETVFDLLVLHQPLECRTLIGKRGDGTGIVILLVQRKTEVRIIQYPTPSAWSFRAPSLDITTRPVPIHHIDFRQEVVQELIDVDDSIYIRIVFWSIYLLGGESSEAQNLIVRGTFMGMRALVQVKLIVTESMVGEDKVLVGTFTNIQHTIIDTIHKDHGRLVSLMVDIQTGSGRLQEPISEIGATEVIARVTQHDALPTQVRLLLEDRIVQLIIAIDFSGIDLNGLHVFRSRASTEVAYFHLLIQAFRLVAVK